ncbi:hypothetical protein BSL78_13101 [Apostichopus japonicus]|uniref:Uncharacterized protein n=1 Tax=Stichopus japonicus TaxID=307972 RepID=A0A2G8KPY3_STIJA|nr:hypothetical protein BSL78_13101 [Apostichopus japonicus]
MRRFDLFVIDRLLPSRLPKQWLSWFKMSLELLFTSPVGLVLKSSVMPSIPSDCLISYRTPNMAYYTLPSSYTLVVLRVSFGRPTPPCLTSKRAACTLYPSPTITTSPLISTKSLSF